MKIIKLSVLLSLFTLFSQVLLAQDTEQPKEKLRTAADLKSGNSQDVLISFFQLAAQDLFGDNKTFKFQSSLFAIKAKTDDALWIDSNYLKERFARNFVISVSPAFDSSFRYKSNSIGLKYAIINNRDKTVFDFSQPEDMIWLKLQQTALNQYAQQFTDGVRNPLFQRAINFFLDEDEPGRTSVANLPDDFKALLKKLTDKSIFRGVGVDSFRNHLANEYSRLSQYVENRGLWTAEANFTSLNNGNLFSGINLSSEYLKGLLNKNARSNLELNLKASLDFSDDSTSLSANDLHRQVFSFAGGFNWVIVKNRNNKSVLELKGAVAYNNILKTRYTDEEWSKFTGEGVLRFRLTNDIWIPVEIKYDPKNGNVFGFISVKSNFNWLKGKQN